MLRTAWLTNRGGRCKNDLGAAGWRRELHLQVSAAAPDMYEALKALLRWANRLPDGDYKRAIEAARAAIAKAEGN